MATDGDLFKTLSTHLTSTTQCMFLHLKLFASMSLSLDGMAWAVIGLIRDFHIMWQSIASLITRL